MVLHVVRHDLHRVRRYGTIALVPPCRWTFDHITPQPRYKNKLDGSTFFAYFTWLMGLKHKEPFL